MFAIKVKGMVEQLIIEADSFELTNDKKYVYFLKGKNNVGLFVMENIRSVVQVSSLSGIK